MENQQKKILVVGDLIYDQYVFGKATRLCPEAPVPVLVPDGPMDIRLGGAGLVREQLREFGDAIVHSMYGSYSRKTRYVADGHIILRTDEDSYELRDVSADLVDCASDYDAVVISDYSKGTFTSDLADKVIWECTKYQIPTFVDAKKNWDWYTGANFFFPNESETPNMKYPNSQVTTVVQKLGERGALVNGNMFTPSRPHAVRDVSGAGDIFMAAFVYAKLVKCLGLADCISFANRVAGISVEHIGTHVVTKEELDKSYEVC